MRILIVLLPIFLICLSLIFPIKVTLKNIPNNDGRDFLIITGYYHGKGWDIIGDNTGLFEMRIKS